MKINKVSFIGLGVMGYPMAGHLKKNNLEVTVFNRTESKSNQWVEKFKGKKANSPGDAAKNAEIIFICVGRDEDLRQVMEGNDGILQNASENTIIVDHTTASAKIAREFYKKAKELNLSFLDAPVSGGQAGAENGKLSIMIGGENEIFNVVEPILKSYGKTILHLDVGQIRSWRYDNTHFANKSYSSYWKGLVKSNARG